MPEPLTKLERRILDYLVDYVRRNTYQPSIREIGRRFDIKSTKTVSEYLQSLADKGWIERDPSRSRGVRLLGVDLQPQTVTVPWFGGVAPEGEALAGDAVVDEFQLDRKLSGASGAFLIAMRGNSMEAAGIADGDLLLVQPCDLDELTDGEIVLARLAGEGAVKRLFRRDTDVVLEAATTRVPPTLVHQGDDFQLLGRIVGLIRRIAAPVAAPVSQAVADAKPRGLVS